MYTKSVGDRGIGRTDCGRDEGTDAKSGGKWGTQEWFEQQVKQALKETGQTLLTGVCELSAERYVASAIECACGGVAVYQRKRAGKTQTLFGEVVVKRAYYLCEQCHHGLLWAGQGTTVIAHLKATSSHKSALHDVLTYFRNHQHRKRYDLYRTSGFQIGSGTIESGCKHVIAARFKQAGFIWSFTGACSIAKLRCRLKSRRWHQSIALYSFSPRSCHRLAA